MDVYFASNVLLVFLTQSTLSFVESSSCFNCASPDQMFNATLRHQLVAQSDVFFYPAMVLKTSACSGSISSADDAGVFFPNIEGEICSKYPHCVTLLPNIPNSTAFVIRGCLETVLRHTFRENLQLHENGCYLLRSSPAYPHKAPLDFVLCVCLGDYCNGQLPPESVDGPYEFGDSHVLRLSTFDAAGLQVGQVNSVLQFDAAVRLLVLLVILVPAFI